MFGKSGHLRKNTGKTVAVPKLTGMRIFVYEYTCGGPAKEVTCGALRSEGWAMLSALLADLERVPGVETVTVLPAGAAYVGKTVVENAHDDEETSFCRLARQADYTLVIAPEFRDILATRCRWVLSSLMIRLKLTFTWHGSTISTSRSAGGHAGRATTTG